MCSDFINYYKKFLFVLCIFVSLAFILTRFLALDKKEPYFFHGRTEDKVIQLTWKIPSENATLTVSEKDKVLFTKQVKGTDNFSFSGGVHGKVYKFDLNYVDYENNKKNLDISRSFFDYKKLPSLEILRIDTFDGESPYYENASAPKDYFGSTIKNNHYKKATLNDTIPVKIKVRGNTSTYTDKKPYKLFFKDNIDILNLGEEYADREWYLLSADSFKTYFGLHLSKFMGMEWEPRIRFVNLMLNGDYRGLYVLCESVKPHPMRAKVDKKGFLIESDAYFWNERGLFFDSSLLLRQVRFTFKYPKVTSKFQPRVLATMTQMKKVEDAIKTNSPNIGDYIDIDTFVSWQMSHEFMGSWDSAGSNIYFYKQNMNKDSKLKMGPVWDFDSVFRMEDNEHSRVWFDKTTYFPFLLDNKVFRNSYKEKYFTVAPRIEKEMLSVLNNLKKIPGLEESRKLNAQIWNKPYKSVDAEIEELMYHLHKRVVWLNEEIGKL